MKLVREKKMLHNQRWQRQNGIRIVIARAIARAHAHAHNQSIHQQEMFHSEHRIASEWGSDGEAGIAPTKTNKTKSFDMNDSENFAIS